MPVRPSRPPARVLGVIAVHGPLCEVEIKAALPATEHRVAPEQSLLAGVNGARSSDLIPRSTKKPAR
jgi:hypothetical protein